LPAGVQDRANTHAAPQRLGVAGLSGQQLARLKLGANAIVLEVEPGRMRTWRSDRLRRPTPDESCVAEAIASTPELET
jgi:hypothetical protein